MIRIRGFARKTWRLTKGGSLPDSSRAVSTPASEPAPDSTPNLTVVNNGHSNGNGVVHPNGATGRNSVVNRHARNGNGHGPNGNGSNGNGSNGHGSNGNEVTAYLHHVVEDLVESQSPIDARARHNDNGNNGCIDGQPVPRLETLFARTALDIRTGAPSPRWKRIFDVTLVILAMPLWVPLLLLVMAWIKMVSPGPIFYRQERVGYRGRRFMIFKFRTMHVNAETRTHEQYFAHLMTTDSPMTKLDALDDNRLIRCGRLLRATGLDELPQVFNILRGEMSLVGPRPCLPFEFERYTPAQCDRVNALPGLTGLWQVNGKNKTTFSQMVAMDIYYGEHMSAWLDLWIILKTPAALIAQTLEARLRRANDRAIQRMSTASLNGSARNI